MYVEKCRKGTVSLGSKCLILIPNVSTPFGIVFAGLLTATLLVNSFRVRVAITTAGEFELVLLLLVLLLASLTALVSLLFALGGLEFALGEVFADSSLPLDKDGESFESCLTGEGEFDASINTFSSPKKEEFVVFKSIRLIMF